MAWAREGRGLAGGKRAGVAGAEAWAAAAALWAASPRGWSSRLSLFEEPGSPSPAIGMVAEAEVA